jgi:hypothetical protein
VGSEELVAFRDDAYRAIGRYVVEFSELFGRMRATLAFSLNRDGDWNTIQMAFGEMTANQITNAFFAACHYGKRLDQNEQKIGRALRARLIEQIERRNDVAHGDWSIGYPEGEPAERYVALIRIKPAKSFGAFEQQDVSTATLDEWSDALVELATMVMDFGHVALGLHQSERVSDLFVFEGKRVVRRS